MTFVSVAERAQERGAYNISRMNPSKLANLVVHPILKIAIR